MDAPNKNLPRRFTPTSLALVRLNRQPDATPFMCLIVNIISRCLRSTPQKDFALGSRRRSSAITKIAESKISALLIRRGASIDGWRLPFAVRPKRPR